MKCKMKFSHPNGGKIMDERYRSIYERWTSHKETLGVLIIEKTKINSHITGQFDAIIIVLEKNNDKTSPKYNVKHYDIANKKAALHIIDEKYLVEIILVGIHRRVMDWVLNGEVLLDKDGFIERIRKKLHQFPVSERKNKICIEFAKLVRSCLYGKELYEGNQYLDAYYQMVRSLHHLARLSVIEHGFHPEVTLWNQVKQIEPEVYKLYIELVQSSESIEKRVGLLLLAIEFAISSRARIGSSYLIEIMKTKKTPWTISELMNEKDLKGLSNDIEILLQYLVEKNVLKVKNDETRDESLYHRNYIVD